MLTLYTTVIPHNDQIFINYDPSKVSYVKYVLHLFAVNIEYLYVNKTTLQMTPLCQLQKMQLKMLSAKVVCCMYMLTSKVISAY